MGLADHGRDVGGYTVGVGEGDDDTRVTQLADDRFALSMAARLRQ